MKTAPAAVMIANIGTADLVLSNWALTGPFAFVTPPANGLTIMPGHSASVPVAFDPTGSFIATGRRWVQPGQIDDGWTRIWGTADGKQWADLIGGGGIVEPARNPLDDLGRAVEAAAIAARPIPAAQTMPLRRQIADDVLAQKSGGPGDAD